MSSMRALWIVRRNLRRHPGGDTVQILKTAAMLREQGVLVELTSNSHPRREGVDLIHMFHLDRVWENVPQAKRAKRAGLPVVLSPIWWPPDEFDRRGREGMQGQLARLVGSRMYQNVRLGQRSGVHLLSSIAEGQLTGVRISFQSSVRKLLSRVDVLLPNSRAEAEVISERWGNDPPSVVVPNGVDTRVMHSSVSGGSGRGVLCVGRIEPRKNQLTLIRAVRGTGRRLTLVGGAGRFSRGYLRACRQEADERVEFTGPLRPRAVQRMYRSHAVHCAPSWYETPGLASLEAAVCGCPVVVSRRGSPEEYFGEEAHYCEPDDPDSIRAAIESACAGSEEVSAGGGLAARIREKFTWEEAAIETLKAYRDVLDQT